MTSMKLSPANTAITNRPPAPTDKPQAVQETATQANHTESTPPPEHATRANQAAQTAQAAPLGTITIAKIDTNLRELKASDAALTFALEKQLSSAAYQAAHLLTEAGTQIFQARCTSNAHRDLARCVLKVTSDAELAHNEWDHLSNMKSSAFPTGFVLGRVVGDDSDGEGERPMRLAIAMELIEGDTLTALIERGFGAEGSCAPVEKALEIMSPLAGAFRDLSLSLHPFVHRDVKPDNIIVSHARGKRRTRIIDVGVSSHRGDPRQREHLGCSAGFAAPEIARPQDYPAHLSFSIDDARIDTYGLAATFFALVTGRCPEGNAPSLDAHALTHDADTLADIMAAAKASIFEKHLIEADGALLEALMSRALARRDEAFARCIERGLSFPQSDRPTPVEFFEMLPTNYRSTIVNDVHLLFLESLVASQATTAPHAQLKSVHLGAEESVDLRDTALADEYRYPGFQDDFHQAMALYNAGRYHEAVPLLAKLDEAGDATSSYNLGVCYKDGLGGLERDDMRKLACWTRAAEGGHVMAVFNVGVCHEEGLGIPRSAKSNAAARAWYERAARMGLPAAADRLAQLDAAPSEGSAEIR